MSTNPAATSFGFHSVAIPARFTGKEERPRRDDEMVVVRPETDILSKQRLPYFVGVSGAAGATAISMNLVVIPPASAAQPHFHRGFESAVYMMRGSVNVRYGHNLERLLTLDEGDFLFIPADLPHQPINLDPVSPALAIVARNDPNEQESVEIFTEG